MVQKVVRLKNIADYNCQKSQTPRFNETITRKVGMGSTLYMKAKQTMDGL